MNINKIIRNQKFDDLIRDDPLPQCALDSDSYHEIIMNKSKIQNILGSDFCFGPGHQLLD